MTQWPLAIALIDHCMFKYRQPIIITIVHPQDESLAIRGRIFFAQDDLLSRQQPPQDCSSTYLLNAHHHCQSPHEGFAQCRLIKLDFVMKYCQRHNGPRN